MAGTRRGKVRVLPGQTALFDKAVLTASGLATLPDLRQAVIECTACPLHKGRMLPVFGEGLADSPQVAFVGEAPGELEDRMGRPFIGKSGRLLDEMLGWMRLKRTDVWITNAVACRPFMNATPEPAEILACRAHLLGQIRAVRPTILVALGKTAATAILGKPRALADLRGSWFHMDGISVRVTYHPSFLLRENTPEYLDEARVDLAAVRRRLDGEG